MFWELRSNYCMFFVVYGHTINSLRQNVIQKRNSKTLNYELKCASTKTWCMHVCMYVCIHTCIH